jgi:hypothetical protein
MISDLDIYRAANLVIKRHGGDAVIEGRALWQRIRRAIEVLQAQARGPVH